ncbi:MAG: DUF937 domain-containing protein [Alphaproteobacteria bacterium]
MSLMQLIGQYLDGPALDAIGQQAGLPRDKVEQALPPALALLTSSLSNNAREGGASGMMNAVERDHDGSLLDSLPGLLGSMAAQHGGGILGHLMGAKQDTAAEGVARAGGIDKGSAMKLLVALAPVVMAALGKQKRQKGLGESDLADFLGGERAQAEAALPSGAAGLTKLLDADGDGSVMDEITEIGGGLLGGLFGGKK